MALKRNEKKEILDSLTKNIGGSESAVFVKFGGLTVADSTAMRTGLREKGIGYMVSKKTLLKRALGETSPAGEMPVLEGQISVAYGNDAVLPAKTVAEFQSKFKDKLWIVGGVLSGKYMSAPEMIALSKIPTREVLLGQLLNVMSSSVRGFVIALDQIAKKRG